MKKDDNRGFSKSNTLCRNNEKSNEKSILMMKELVEFIPIELWGSHILQPFSHHSLSRFKIVCKKWSEIIDNIIDRFWTQYRETEMIESLEYHFGDSAKKKEKFMLLSFDEKEVYFKKHFADNDAEIDPYDSYYSYYG